VRRAMTDPAIAVSRAVTRRPAPSAVDGLRAADTGPPDIARLIEEHAAYEAALREAGAEVIALPPLVDYPDALFVEDTALCLPEGAVMLRPGAPSRRGEVAEMAPALAPLVPEIRHLAGPGHVEGGDILFTGPELLVGRSARTDAEGIEALRALLARWGRALRAVETPPGVLHFKTGCALLGPDEILATRRLAATGCFAGYRVREVPEGEEAAANVVRVNDLVLMPAGFPRTAELLDRAGHAVREVPTAQAATLDGGMSCLSLRLP